MNVGHRSEALTGPHPCGRGPGVGWRYKSIALIEAEKGEVKAQACDKAWFRSIIIDLIRHFAGKIPVLGVCLGHQAIGEAFGGRVVRAPHLMHGKTSPVMHDNRTVFQGFPMPMTATRYHSLIVEEKDLPSELEVSAWATEKDGSRTIMGLRHRRRPVDGVQFHPESVLTEAGKKLVANFLGCDIELCGQITSPSDQKCRIGIFLDSFSIAAT